MPSSNWIVGVEYLYVDLGRLSYTEINSLLYRPPVSDQQPRNGDKLPAPTLDYKF